MKLVRVACIAAALTAPGLPAPADAGALSRIKAEQTIRLGYRADAPPFSYTTPGAALPLGYMADLCRAVTNRLAAQLSLPSLKITYVPVTAAKRFEAVEKGNADLLCEPTSATLSRRQRVDFSIATFVDGASLMTADANLRDVRDLAGRKVGVLAGTTTEQSLRNSLRVEGITAEVVPARTHEEGLAMIDGGRVSAYFADRSILMFLLGSSNSTANLRIAENYLTIEPYPSHWPRVIRNSAWPSIPRSATSIAAVRCWESSTGLSPVGSGRARFCERSI